MSEPGGAWDASTAWRAAGVGAIGGAASGLLGIGGGVVMVPLLVLMLGLTQQEAHGTSLAILIFTAIAAAIVYRAAGPLDLRLAALLAAGAVAGAPLGARVAGRWSDDRLRRAFGALLVVVAIRLLLVRLDGGEGSVPGGLAGAALMIAVGFVVGWLSGLLGVGGGTILVPILTLAFHVPQHGAQGVSLFMIVPTSIAGAWTYHRLGHVRRSLVAPAAIASVVTAAAAALVANALAGPTLRVLFAIVLAIMGARMLVARSRP